MVKNPQEKAHTLEQRAKQRVKHADKIKTLQDELFAMLEVDVNQSDGCHDSVTMTLDQLIQLYQGTELGDRLTTQISAIDQASKQLVQFHPNLYQDVIQLCHLMGVPTLWANWEADALCAKLYQTGQVQAVMSEDADLLMYGGGRLIRKFSWANTVELIDLNCLLRLLKIDYQQFIDLCILCGTDYTAETITNLGTVRAYELIRQSLTVEQIIASISAAATSSDPRLKTFKKYSLPTDMANFDYPRRRHLVRSAHESEPDVQLTPFNITDLQFDQLATLMTEKCRYQHDTLQKHFQQIRDGVILMTPKPKLKIKVKIHESAGPL